jgi:hypothetical protein
LLGTVFNKHFDSYFCLCCDPATKNYILKEQVTTGLT